MTYTRLNPKPRFSSDVLLSWGAYTDSSGSIQLSHPVTDYDFVVFRFGYDAPDGDSGGMYNVPLYMFTNLVDGTSSLNVAYMQGAVSNFNRAGILKVIDSTHVKIVRNNSFTSSPALRTVVGIKVVS